MALFEQILKNIGSQSRICRQLYEPRSGGYHLPVRMQAERLSEEAIGTYRSKYPEVRYDCVELPVADLLASLVLNTGSTTIIETGTSRGFSTCHLAAAARIVATDAVVHTLDSKLGPNRFFESEDIAENIVATIGNSLEFDVQDRLDGRRIDFLFLDSLHSFGHLNREIAYFGSKLKLGGIIVMHDTMCYDGLALLVLQMQRMPFFEAVTIPTHRSHGDRKRSCPGVSIFRKVAEFKPSEVTLPVLLPILETEAPFMNSRQIERVQGPLSLDRTYEIMVGEGGARGRNSTSLLEPAKLSRQG